MNILGGMLLTDNAPGDPKKLKSVGVKPIVDLPGVGLNFQDHYLTFSVYRAKPETDSFDDFARGDPEVQKREFFGYSVHLSIGLV